MRGFFIQEKRFSLFCSESFNFERQNVFPSAELMMSVYNEWGGLNILVQAHGGAAEIKSQCVFKCDVWYFVLFFVL